MQAVLCADIGTSSLKAALVAEDGTFLAESRVPFAALAQSAGAGDLWLNALAQASRQIRAELAAVEGSRPSPEECAASAEAEAAVKSGCGAGLSVGAPNREKGEGFSASGESRAAERARPSSEERAAARAGLSNCSGVQIAALCISGNGPTIASPHFVHLWNAPNGSAAQNLRYAQMAGGSLFLPRLLYLKENKLELFNKSGFVFSGPEYLIWQLTEKAVTVLPEARFERAYWDSARLRACDFPSEKLPPFVAPGFCAGSLTPAAAKLLALDERTGVYCGTPDFVAALLGTATTRAGMLCDRAGSSEGLNLCTAEPLRAEGVRTLPSAIGGLWNASVLLPDSGLRFSAFKAESVYKDAGYEEMVRELLAKPRSQGYKLMQSIALEVKNGVELLRRATGLPLGSMRVTGGQAHNAAWNQFKADICGVRIKLTRTADAELTGDAVTAFYGMGRFATLEAGAAALVRTTRVFEPGGEA